MGEIKQFRIGLMRYLFEVKDSCYREPPELFGLTPMMQECYIPEPGSVVRYNIIAKPLIMEVVEDVLWFPKDGCVKPLLTELEIYEGFYSV